MISRSRSAPTAAAMSIECTTSANSTVTCLYSADRLTCVTGAPHSSQNLAFSLRSTPHVAHANPAAVMSSPRTSRCAPRNPGDLASRGIYPPSRDPAAVPSIAHVNIVSPLARRQVHIARATPSGT